jgi:hypothetical protein
MFIFDMFPIIEYAFYSIRRKKLRGERRKAPSPSPLRKPGFDYLEMSGFPRDFSISNSCPNFLNIHSQNTETQLLHNSFVPYGWVQSITEISLEFGGFIFNYALFSALLCC